MKSIAHHDFSVHYEAQSETVCASRRRIALIEDLVFPDARLPPGETLNTNPRNSVLVTFKIITHSLDLKDFDALYKLT